MKYVDEETRKEFRDKRLQALEADNYLENESKLAADDDAYEESDVSASFQQIFAILFEFSHMLICQHRKMEIPKRRRSRLPKQRISSQNGIIRHRVVLIHSLMWLNVTTGRRDQ